MLVRLPDSAILSMGIVPEYGVFVCDVNHSPGVTAACRCGSVGGVMGTPQK